MPCSRDSDDLRVDLARPFVQNDVGRDDAALERDLQRARLQVGRVARVVSRTGRVDGDDEPVSAADDPRVAWSVRERDVRESGEEDDESVWCDFVSE